MTQDPFDLAYTRAQAAWPGVALPRDAFRGALLERIREGSPEDAIPSMQTDDLYLALACLAGNRAALDAFEQTMGATIAASLARFDLSEPERKDLIQQLRVGFFVKKSIAGYSARGALRGWVRSAATRAALDLVGARKQRPDDEDAILGSLPATGDPELDLLRSRFVADFRDAFAATLASLAAEDRAILAQHYVDDLTIDQLAAVHGIHRATAARKVARLRALLLEGTKERLQHQQSVDASTFDSLMRLAGSRLHVSVFRLLKG